MYLTELLSYSSKNNASDLHLSAGLSPLMRVDGDLCSMDWPILTHDEVLKMIHQIMSHQQKIEFEKELEIDFSFEIPKLARFRVNVFNQLRGVAAVFRIIPSKVLSLDELNLPMIFKEIASLPRGLILITGPTGSGKSTTLAAMIDYINSSRHHHVLTIEDPIEFIHESNHSLINQREVYRNTLSFAAALHSALREDPDVIMVGELRDLDTIRLAITAAETGHLVLGTLHTNSATQTINRIIDVFPAEEKSLIRSMLSESLQAVITQTLLKKNGSGRVAALEIMRCTGAIRHLIRENKTAQMYSYLQTGQSTGMHTLDQHLLELVNNSVILKQIAYNVAVDKSLFC